MQGAIRDGIRDDIQDGARDWARDWGCQRGRCGACGARGLFCGSVGAVGAGLVPCHGAHLSAGHTLSIGFPHAPHTRPTRPTHAPHTHNTATRLTSSRPCKSRHPQPRPSPAFLAFLAFLPAFPALQRGCLRLCRLRPGRSNRHASPSPAAAKSPAESPTAPSLRPRPPSGASSFPSPLAFDCATNARLPDPVCPPDFLLQGVLCGTPVESALVVATYAQGVWWRWERDVGCSDSSVVCAMGSAAVAGATAIGAWVLCTRIEHCGRDRMPHTPNRESAGRAQDAESDCGWGYGCGIVAMCGIGGSDPRRCWGLRSVLTAHIAVLVLGPALAHALFRALFRAAPPSPPPLVSAAPFLLPPLFLAILALRALILHAVIRPFLESALQNKRRRKKVMRIFDLCEGIGRAFAPIAVVLVSQYYYEYDFEKAPYDESVSAEEFDLNHQELGKALYLVSVLSWGFAGILWFFIYALEGKPITSNSIQSMASPAPNP
eukprot:TRINITY_DN3106_c0_g1_i2.p1 TRINITY_DN3106_c0_g1~~TRINITY_DN3106_c0_g1_i2.p1  ORF type:complete len:490 (-),score=48.35 TRINITY_DN3106_c0_g1_i2:359-1828(-)